MGKVITGLPSDLSTCEKMKGDLDRITHWAGIFKTPLTLAKMVAGNVVKNMVPIGNDITHIA